jgi:hypothetical protein
MTQYEYLELLAMARQQTAGGLMNCLVIISAYLVAAYVAGHRLPSVFLWPIAILYSLFLLGPARAAQMGFHRMDVLSKELFSPFPDSPFKEPPIGRFSAVLFGVAHGE